MILYKESIGTGKKTTTWASVASQPAKSQPKLLKSKMAASGLTGSTSKHLPPTVTMDAISWDSKNGAIGNGPLGSKTIPPPTVISAPSISPVLGEWIEHFAKQSKDAFLEISCICSSIRSCLLDSNCLRIINNTGDFSFHNKQLY